MNQEATHKIEQQEAFPIQKITRSRALGRPVRCFFLSENIDLVAWGLGFRGRQLHVETRSFVIFLDSLPSAAPCKPTSGDDWR